MISIKRYSNIIWEDRYTVLPDKAKQVLFKKEIFGVWESLLSHLQIFVLALADKNQTGDEKRKEIRIEILLGKPIAQFALVMAFLRIRESAKEDGSVMKDSEVIERLNAIDWKVSNPIWQHVLMSGDKVVSGRTAALYASRFIAYLAGEKLSPQEKSALLENYIALYPPEERKDKKLPPPIC